MKKKKQNKIQKRSIEVIEYEDGTSKIEGPAWDLDCSNSEELGDVLMHWLNNNIETYPKNVGPQSFGIPKLIKDNIK